jgi:DNA-binding response OmpR family regulator
MTELYLIAADKPLRTALAEQMKPAFKEHFELLESDGVPAVFSGHPAAIVLDAPQADKKAFKILREVRESHPRLKLFILGECDDDDIVSESFPKPLRLGHLLARLQFHLQGARMHSEPFRFGPFCLEPAARQVVIEDSDAVIRLTEKETHLLEYLGRSKKPVPREELLAAIWGYDARIDTHTLETHVYRLRRKLEAGGTQVIVMEQGVYSLAAAP